MRSNAPIWVALILGVTFMVWAFFQQDFNGNDCPSSPKLVTEVQR